MTSLATRLFTWLHGRRVGADRFGNIYYTETKRAGALRARRWVIYSGEPEASGVPPEWHAWLHFTVDAPLTAAVRRVWQKPHIANETGTPGAYRPAGHDYAGGARARATGDYEAWTPDGDGAPVAPAQVTGA